MKEKHKIFIQEYVKDFNGAAAARRAGYSETQSERRAYELLRDPEIQNYLKELLTEIKERNMVSVEDLIGELKMIAFSNLSKCFDNEGNLMRPDQLEESLQKSLSDFEVNEYPTKSGIRKQKKVKLHSKLDAIEKLMRYVGAYEKDNGQQKTLVVNWVSDPKNEISDEFD